MTKEQKIEQAARKHDPFGSIDMWSNARMDFTAGANFGYELAVEEMNHVNLTLHEKITELEQHQKDMEILFRQQQETITTLSLREKELEQQLKQADELLIDFKNNGLKWNASRVSYFQSQIEQYLAKRGERK